MKYPSSSQERFLSKETSDPKGGMIKLHRIVTAWRPTPKQRDTALKIVINASNAVLGGVVLGNVLSRSFHMKTFVAGFGVYLTLVAIALWVDR